MRRTFAVVLLVVPSLSLGVGCGPQELVILEDDDDGGGSDGGIGVGGDAGSGESTGDDCDEVWYVDEDGDGWGVEEVETCDPDDDMVEDGGDCDDESADVYPGAEEQCNGIDDDCDGELDPASCEPGDLGFEASQSMADATAKLTSLKSGYYAGHRFDAGDVDGDGVDDLLSSAMWANSYTGGAYLVSGPITASANFTDVGIWIGGGTGAYEGGRAMGIAEGTDDGYEDVLMGAPDASQYDAVVIFGPIEDNLTFNGADLRMYCTPAIECGHGADFQDVTGDGIADAIVGAGEETHGGSSSGSLYFLFGPLSAGEIDLRETHDAELIGESAGVETGRRVWAQGDFDGDGIGDLLAAASYDSTSGLYAGAVWAVEGPFSGAVAIADVGAKILGESAEDYMGETIGMGDIDGDGLTDAMVASYTHARYDGAVYVINGPISGTISTSDADVIVRGESREGMGTSASIGDVDGDGVGELLVGAAYDDSAERDAGAAYLYQGPMEGSYLTSDAAHAFFGEARNDSAGLGTRIADLDADGRGEVIIGAPAESSGGSAAGAVYLFSPP